MTIMKKIFRFMMAAIAATAAMTACQQENLEPEVQEQETVQVKVTIGEQTKGFTDLEGITWEVGDQIKYAGGVELTSQPLTAEQISEDGYTASFTFAASLNEVDRTGWFCSTKCHPGNYTEVEFTLGNGSGNIYTQDVAGEMNSRYLFLHSGTGIVQIKKDETPEFNMNIAGSIFRLIPYTSSYNNEKVLSVKMVSGTNMVGTVAYDRGAGTYRGVNDINWQAKNFVKVELGTSFSLEGVTTADQSKGIYMAVAATKADLPLNGYQYVVETDKATYTFDAMDKSLVVDENVVKNVFLNLDKAVRVSEGGQLQYIGDLGNAANNQLSAYGATDFDGGYWYAQVRADENAAWANRDGDDNVHFYNSVEFEVTDPDTGAPVDWLTVRYGGAGGSHWLISVEENTGAARSAVITATFPDVKGYVVVDECKTKVITVTQAATGGPKAVTYGSASLPASITIPSTVNTDYNAGYCLLIVEGAEYRDWSGIYSGVTFKCVSEEDASVGNYDNEVDWLSCRYATDASGIYDCIWWLSADANESAESRTAVIVALFPEDDEYAFPEPRKLVVTQQPGTDPTIYDPASAANLWNTMTVEEMFCYYAPGWNKIYASDEDGSLQEGDMFSSEGNNYTFTMSSATYERWQAQFAFRTDISTVSTNNYDFYCVIESNNDVGNALVKLVQTGADGNYYFESPVALVAGEEYVFKMPNMQGRDMEKLSLFFDFGGNPANTIINVKDIIIQEHQE